MGSRKWFTRHGGEGSAPQPEVPNVMMEKAVERAVERALVALDQGDERTARWWLETLFRWGPIFRAAGEGGPA